MLAERLAQYIGHRMPAAEQIEVTGLERIYGGASRETYRFVASYRLSGHTVSRPLILRRDPPGSLINTQRAVEFEAYRAFHGTAVPVPEPLWLEQESPWLDYPFFIMQEVQGFESDPRLIIGPPYAEHAQRLAEQKWTILGEIAKADPVALGLTAVMEPLSPDRCWERELGFWEKELDADELCPQPVMRAAIRWLRRNPPPPAQKISVVHADFRTGNFLYDTDGTIHAILDWEMAHLGDPIEDLAWGLNPVWRWAHDQRAGGLVPQEEAIRIWERASGLRAPPEALHWWQVFSSVKGQAIWVSSAKEFTDGKNQDLILTLASWMMLNSQDRAALAELGHLS